MYSPYHAPCRANPAALTNLQDGLNFNGYTIRQCRDPHCHSRVPTRLTKDLNKEVRCSVNNLRLTRKFRGRVDIASNPNTPTHAIEVAIQSVPSLRNKIQRAKAGCLLTFFHRKVTPELADESPLAIPL